MSRSGKSAMSDCYAAFGPKAKQSILLKGGNVRFPRIKDYTARCLAIALPRLITTGHCFGNSLTLQEIIISCLPKCGAGDANTDGEI